MNAPKEVRYVDLVVNQGETIRLPAYFISGREAVDPESCSIEVVNSHLETVVRAVEPHREEVGRYHYDYFVAKDAPLGKWQAIWTCVIDGSETGGTDEFEVIARESPSSTDTDPVLSGGDSNSGDYGSVASVAPPADGESVGEAVPAPSLSTNGAKTDTKSPGRRSRRRVLVGAGVIVVIALIALAIWFTPWEQESAQSKIDRGVAAQNSGRGDEARNLYEEVLADDPDNSLANYNLGVMSQRAGELDEAERFYAKSLETKSDFAPAMFNLAILKERMGKNEESADAYNRLIEAYPDNPAARINLGFLLIENLNRREDGIAQFRVAIELQPDLISRIPEELRGELQPVALPPPEE